MFFSTIRNKTDEELMALVRLGNSDALAELYRRYSGALLRYFFRMLWKNRDLADDFLHDLFLKVIDNADRFDSQRRFSTWLYSIAHNMCKNEYRRQAFRESVHATKGEEVIPEKDLQPNDVHDFKSHLERALTLLDVDEKNLYTLKFEVDLPIEEIALTLSCPIGTVKSRIFYLKKKLAIELKEYNPIKKVIWK